VEPTHSSLEAELLMKFGGFLKSDNPRQSSNVAMVVRCTRAMAGELNVE
jgi:hypothetical protein